MEEYNIELEELNTLNKYFEVLKNTGYYNYKDVKKVVILDFIRELLSDNFSIYITEEDYASIADLLYCLFGSNCLIPYPVFISNLPMIGNNYDDDQLRITENEILRNTEDVYFRMEV